MYESTGPDRLEPTGPTDRNQTDRNLTDWNQTDRTDRTDRTGPTGPDRTRVTSAEQRLPIKDEVSRIKDHGSVIMDHGSRIKDHGSWIMDQRSWIKDQGSWTLDLGPCSGMNDHPGRDTDVRSRPSESTIKDLSFYMGFTMTQ